MGTKILSARNKITQDLFEQLDLLVVDMLRMPYEEVMDLAVDDWCEYVARAEYILNTLRSSSYPMVNERGKVSYIPMTLQLDLASYLDSKEKIPKKDARATFSEDVREIQNLDTALGIEEIPGVYNSGTG